jgi:hypothetical protein
MFDKRVLARSPREVIFTPGQLTQFYHSGIHNSLEAKRKLLPKWSIPCRITEWLRNSYRLENLDGTPIPEEFHARRLRAFLPKEGTKLAEEQKWRDKEQRKIRVEEEEEQAQNKENLMDEDSPVEEDQDDEEEEENEDVRSTDEAEVDEDKVMVDEDVSVFEGGTWSGGPLGRRVA